MRIEQIAENLIKVTLTDLDLLQFDMTTDRLSPDSAEINSFLYLLMETIKKETDFNPYNGQVVVEAIPTKDGVTIMISKTKSKKVVKKQVKKITPILKKDKIKKAIYIFDNFEHLCSVLEQLDDEVLRLSSVYQMEQQFQLVLTAKEQFLKSSCIAAEFAIDRNLSDIYLRRVMEHGQLIAKEERLFTMAQGIRRINHVVNVDGIG